MIAHTWLNSAVIIIYYICYTNDAILLYENIFFDGKKVFTAGSCLQPAVRRFVSSTGGVDVSITNGSRYEPAVMAPLSPTT